MEEIKITLEFPRLTFDKFKTKEIEIIKNNISESRVGRNFIFNNIGHVNFTDEKCFNAIIEETDKRSAMNAIVFDFIEDNIHNVGFYDKMIITHSNSVLNSSDEPFFHIFFVNTTNNKTIHYAFISASNLYIKLSCLINDLNGKTYKYVEENRNNPYKSHINAVRDLINNKSDKNTIYFN